MCDPVSIGVMALSAGGAMINGQEQAANNSRMIAARNAATQAELARQKVFQDQAGGIFDTSLGAFSPGTQQSRLANGQADATALFTGNAPTAATVGGIGTKNASDYTRGEENRTVADVFANNATREQALGNLTGWDNLNFQNKVGLATADRGLGTISDLASNSARVSGLEQTIAPMNAYRPPSGLGDLLTFAGSALGSGRLGGLGGSTLPTSSMYGHSVPANPFGFS